MSERASFGPPFSLLDGVGRFGGRVRASERLALPLKAGTWFIVLASSPVTVKRLPAATTTHPVMLWLGPNITLEHSSKLLMPNSQNYTFAALQNALFVPIGNGTWVCVAIFNDPNLVRDDVAQSRTQAKKNQAQANIGLAGHLGITASMTLTSGLESMNGADVTGATRVYLTRSLLPTWDVTNSRFNMVDMGAELFWDTTDNTKSPAAVGNNQTHDTLFWLDNGVPIVSRSVAWASDTSRGTGAGTAEAEYMGFGLYVNKYAVTNGPAARMGLIVGGTRSNGSATIDWMQGTSAAGGGEARLCVANAFNEREVIARVRNSTTSWSKTSATIAALDDGNGTSGLKNRISFLSLFQRHCIAASAAVRVSVNGTNALAYGGLALDATNVMDHKAIEHTASALRIGMVEAHENYRAQLGWHFIQHTAASDGTNSAGFVGGEFHGLDAVLRM